MTHVHNLVEPCVRLSETVLFRRACESIRSLSSDDSSRGILTQTSLSTHSVPGHNLGNRSVWKGRITREWFVKTADFYQNKEVVAKNAKLSCARPIRELLGKVTETFTCRNKVSLPKFKVSPPLREDNGSWFEEAIIIPPGTVASMLVKRIGRPCRPKCM